MKGILLISGNATSGKDTFFTGLKLIFGDSVKRFAFADALKIDTDPLARRIFNKTISCLSKDEKELFRPILVDYGNIMRKVNPLYWIEQVDNEIKKEEYPDYAIITDCRYENEIEFFKKNYSCPVKLLYIERYDCFGSIIPPANEIEKENNIKLKRHIDFSLSWETLGNNIPNATLFLTTKHFIEHGMQNFFGI